jgi:hypothetical protein
MELESNFLAGGMLLSSLGIPDRQRCSGFCPPEVVTASRAARLQCVVRDET